MRKTDVIVLDGKSVVVFTPISGDAEAWFADQLTARASGLATPWSGGMCCPCCGGWSGVDSACLGCCEWPTALFRAFPVHAPPDSSADHHGAPTSVWMVGGVRIKLGGPLPDFKPISPRAARWLSSFSGWNRQALTAEEQRQLLAALDNPRAGWSEAAGIVLHGDGLTLWKAVAVGHDVAGAELVGEDARWLLLARHRPTPAPGRRSPSRARHWRRCRPVDAPQDQAAFRNVPAGNEAAGHLVSVDRRLAS
jgi:hypothetical protein